LRILALIPARGGSKRLPGKNIRMLGGKPLINWTIDVVRYSSEICDILVSTDDPAIAEHCRNAGVLVPWLRPEELATDTANSVDVALHALTWYQREHGNVDALLLLQPTSPFRRRESIRIGIELFRTSEQYPVIGVSPTHAHPMWSLRQEESWIVPYLDNHGFNMRSQDLPPAYVVNGSFYLISPKELLTTHAFIGLKNIPLMINAPQESLDIDTEFDFKLAEFIVETLKQDM